MMATLYCHFQASVAGVEAMQWRLPRPVAEVGSPSKPRTTGACAAAKRRGRATTRNSAAKEGTGPGQHSVARQPTARTLPKANAKAKNRRWRNSVYLQG